MKSVIRKLLFFTFTLAFVGSFAAAQLPGTIEQTPIPTVPTSDTKRPATIEAIRLGFSGVMPADAWCPIRIYLSGNPRINAGAFGGTLTVEYSQDASQSASIVIPIATTPGRVTPNEIIVALPRSAPELRISVRDDAGNLVHERTFSRRGPGGERFPGEIVDGLHLVLLLNDHEMGEGGVPDFARFLPLPNAVQQLVPASNIDDETPPPAFDRLARVLATSDDLPSSAFGLNGLFAVVARSDSLARLARAKAEALSRWVESGGCLIVITTPGPQTWPKLLTNMTLPVEFGEPSKFAPGADLRRVFAEQPAALVNSISGRAIRLTPDGAVQGWRSGWSSDYVAEGSSTTSGPSNEGLLAQGPAALGWVIILGTSPEFAASTAAGIRRVWLDAFRNAIAEADARPFRSGIQRYISRGSGPDQSARTSIRKLLNSLSEIPPLGDGAFLIVAVSLLLLAVAIGPFDAVLLGRRNLRPFSWATALGWIALASAIAAFVPPLIRSGDSISRRLRVVDVVQSSDEQHSSQFWQAGLTTLFSNNTSFVALTGPGEATTAPAGWFRGVSPVRIEEYGESRPSAGFTTFQTEIHDAGQTDATGFRVNRPDASAPLSMGQWTFRTLMDEQAATPEGNASPAVTLDKQKGSWRIGIANPGGEFASGALRIGTSWFSLQKDQQEQNGAKTLRLLASAAPSGLSDWNVRADEPASGGNNLDDPTFRPGLAFELPRVRERSRAIDALIASGAWACIYLYDKETPPTLLARTQSGRGDAFHARESVVRRILVRLDPIDRESATPLASAAFPAPKSDGKSPAKTTQSPGLSPPPPPPPEGTPP